MAAQLKRLVDMLVDHVRGLLDPAINLTVDELENKTKKNTG